MAGRGVQFRAVVDQGGADERTYDIECAKHSPLSIVKEQLHARMPDRQVEDMSLVLQSETDKEDGTLLDDDDEHVQYLGIKSGSTIWVSFLSTAAAVGTPQKPKKPHGAAASPPISPVIEAESAAGAVSPPRVDEAAEEGRAEEDKELAAAEERARVEMRTWLEEQQAEREDQRRQDEMARLAAAMESGFQPDTSAPAPVHEHTVARQVTLDTLVQPRQADHSYNGVVFDVASNGHHELVVHSFMVGGMLGEVRVFAMEGPWHKGQFQQKVQRCGWNNHNDVLDPEDWQQVACVRLAAAWDGTREVTLSQPVRIKPGSARGFYIHSGLPDDLGLQYQSFHSQEEPAAQDEFLTVVPGIGHTGSEPFENYHGWYRAIRGPCGAVRYDAILRTWTAPTHREFPLALRKLTSAVILSACSFMSVCDKNPIHSCLFVMSVRATLRPLTNCASTMQGRA